MSEFVQSIQDDLLGAQNGQGITILLVDDDPAILEGVVDLLRFYGYNLITAIDGKTALELMQGQTPDLVISDIMMPEMDGYEFYEAVRSNADWAPIPFIFLTARGQTVDVRRGKSLGVDDYLVKPFEPEDLLIAIRTKLQRVRDIQSVTQAEVRKMKEQMITIFSHELRTPLTYVYGYINLLQEGISDADQETIDAMLKGVQRGAERLVRLVEDLMLLVRIDSGLVGMEIDHRSVPCDLSAVAGEIVEAAARLAEEKNVQIEVDVPPDLLVSGVSVHLTDALMRLVENGVKFSKREGGVVSITGHTQDDRVVVAVRDEGIGIAPERQQDIFNRFVQIDRDEMEQQGTGLGLPIARSLIDLHGGQITLESRLGQGSTFYITLPRCN
jgi:two-component system sensor histidine kinase/response regulator